MRCRYLIRENCGNWHQPGKPAPARLTQALDPQARKFDCNRCPNRFPQKQRPGEARLRLSEKRYEQV
jgi:hypothetical protein